MYQTSLLGEKKAGRSGFFAGGWLISLCFFRLQVRKCLGFWIFFHTGQIAVRVFSLEAFFKAAWRVKPVLSSSLMMEPFSNLSSDLLISRFIIQAKELKLPLAVLNIGPTR
jgi:hypothetical protein